MDNTVFMFSGQGGQYFQMGRELYESLPVFRASMNRMDNFVISEKKYSVLSELYFSNRKKSEVFDSILITHPAIYMVEYALAQALIDAGLQPNAVMGASLGMFAAGAVAGCFDVYDGLSAVLSQAALLEKVAPQGVMLAVLADQCKFIPFSKEIGFEVSAINFSSHFVVSCTHERINSVEDFFRNHGVVTQRLNVNYAFHSSIIEPIRGHLIGNMRQLNMMHAKIPVWCCASSGMIDGMDGDYFWKVARQPIYFERTFKNMEDGGGGAYFDLGPTGTLATFARYILSRDSQSAVRAIMSPYGGELKNFHSILS